MRRRLTRSDRAEALGKVPLLASCTAAELDQVAALVSDVAVGAGQVLCEMGAVGREFFILAEGEAVLTLADGTVATLQPGECFGELALLDDGPHMTTVTMVSDGRVLDMSGPEFRGLLRAAPTIALRMLPTLAARLRSGGIG